MPRVLIVSWNTIPVEDKSIPISATGMRTYKLALGLLNNGINNVDVAVKNYGPSMGYSSDRRIEIHKWDSDEDLAKLANKYEALIINSNLENTTPYILSSVNDKVVKIVDAFIPLYFEEAMREEIDDKVLKYHVSRLAFLHDSLRLADHILVANSNQKMMYLGALGAVNLLNAANFEAYGDNFLINYPGVVNENIPKENPYKDHDDVIRGRKIVVWFGSIYKWYDISPLLEAYRSDNKLNQHTILFVVGAKNPNFHSSSVKPDKTDDSVIFVPWVDYQDRLCWLANADIGVSLNRLTFENTFSYRNRLIDYIEAGLPIVTNGEDPLGEEIIANDGGLKTQNNISETILDSLESKQNARLRAGVHKLKRHMDNTNNNLHLAKKISERNKKVLNEDYLANPVSDMRMVEKLLHNLHWDKPKAMPVEKLDDVLQFISTKDVTAAAYRRLRKSAASKVKKGNIN